VAPLIEKLRREETDPRRVAVLNVLAQALTDRGEKLMLAFLDIVEASVLTTVELEKLQASLVGSAARDPKKPPLRVDRESVDGLELPRLTTRTMPRYPEYARTQRQQGAVEMLARIEKDGRVGPLWVVRSSGPSFAAEAIAAVRNWRYTPARRDGEVIAFPFTIRVDFRFR
jgi:TonB family protein